MCKTLAKLYHGSHLFGTNTVDSDFDIKSIIQPDYRSVLLGETGWSNRIDPSHVPKTKEEMDIEESDLLKYVQLLYEAQPVAIELLCAPLNFHLVQPDPIWNVLQENYERIISKQSNKFLGYCRRQALSYGMKSERVDAAQKTLEVLKDIHKETGNKTKLKDHLERVIGLVRSEHVHEETRIMQNGTDVRHLQISNKMVPESTYIEYAIDVAEAVVRGYSHRTKAAIHTEGKDWKALSHALRLGYEAIELFDTGWITLPRPEANHLLNVKSGHADPDAIGEEIQDLLIRVETSAQNSTLRESPDLEFLQEVVVTSYGSAVVEALEQRTELKI